MGRLLGHPALRALHYCALCLFAIKQLVGLPYRGPLAFPLCTPRSLLSDKYLEEAYSESFKDQYEAGYEKPTGGGFAVLQSKA